MKTITLTITVPDGVDVQIATTPAQNAPQAAATAPATPTRSCPKHGAEKVRESKFGGVYCTAPDDSEEKGYCSFKAK